MDTRTMTLLTKLAHVEPTIQAEARLGSGRGQPWRRAAWLAFETLLAVALTAAPLLVWAVWLTGR